MSNLISRQLLISQSKTHTELDAPQSADRDLSLRVCWAVLQGSSPKPELRGCTAWGGHHYAQSSRTEPNAPGRVLSVTGHFLGLSSHDPDQNPPHHGF